MHLFLPTVNCGIPNVPGNGFVENIQTTVGGAQIFFRCNPRYVPVGRMSATCIPSNGTWTPDPADLMCIGERQLAHTLHGLAVSRQLLGTLK